MKKRVHATDATSSSIRLRITASAAVKKFADDEVERLRGCVVPIVGGDELRKPIVIGSAVLIKHDERHVLVTAVHVLEDNQAASLAIFGSNGTARPLIGTFVQSLEDDLAAKQLSDDEIADLSHLAFLPVDAIGPVVASGTPFYASVVGYPSTASRRIDRNTIDTRSESWSNIAVEDSNGTVSVEFDKKKGGQSAGKHAKPRDPYGKSGGAIFGIGTEVLPGVSRSPAKLVGISTRWIGKQIVGSSAQRLIALLDQF